MNCFIENLEGRSFCSVSIVNTGIHEIAVHAAVHATPTPVAPVTFAGKLVDANGKTVSILAMSVTRTDSGFNITMVATNPANTKLFQTFKMTADTTGNFSFDSNANGRKLHMQGELGTDAGTRGTWTETRKDGSSAGTFALSLINVPKPAPAPTPAPAITVSLHYQGTATNETGKMSSLTMDLFTAGGSTFGTVKHPNSDGSVDTFTVKIVDGKFANNGDGKGDSISGSFSADKSTVTGYWVRADKLSYATFTLTRS